MFRICPMEYNKANFVMLCWVNKLIDDKIEITHPATERHAQPMILCFSYKSGQIF